MERMSPNKCSFCNSKLDQPFLTLGAMELAGAFRKSKTSIQKRYPLDLTFCENCYAVEVVEKINPKTLFNEYFYFSSKIGTLVQHFSNYASDLASLLKIEPENSTVLEIGCNDGVMLGPLINNGYAKVIGVDPAQNITSQMTLNNAVLYSDFFNQSLAETILNEHGAVDVILANNVFAHINQIADAIKGVKKLLAEGGSFIFEVHSLHNMLANDQFDMIYHEHVYYYSITSCVQIFKLYELAVYDVQKINNHGGSLRIFVTHSDSINDNNKSKNLMKYLKDEENFGIKQKAKYEAYYTKLLTWRKTFMQVVSQLKSDKKQIYGYGASGRANTLLQYCGLTDEIISVIIDDNGAKHDHFTPGSEIIIKDLDYAKRNPPDVIIIFAWTFANEILVRLKEAKIKCEILVPLPSVKFIDGV